MARRFLLLVPLALPAAFTAALAQSPGPGGPAAAPVSDYALTNVRIVTAPGKVIERGTVVTHDGRISAVGAQVNIPADILTNPEAMKRFQDAQNSLGGALRQLMVVAERYPDIKSGQNFLALQSQLEGTENRIAIARRDYIEAVRVYNTELTTFPGRIWRSVMYSSSQPMAAFDIPAQEQQTPKVDFGTKK